MTRLLQTLLIGSLVVMASDARADLSLDEAAARIAEGATFDITFRRDIRVTVYEEDGVGRATLSVPSAEAFVEAVRSNVREREVRALRPITLGWQKIYFGDTKIYDVLDTYREYASGGDEELGYSIWLQNRYLVGAVGNVVMTLEAFSGYADGAAHPNASTDLIPVDGDTGQVANALDIATESSIVEALKTNAEILACIDGDEERSLLAARTFAEADRALSEGYDDRCGGGYPYRGSLMNRFAITGYDPERNRMTLLVQLTYGPEVTRGLFFSWTLEVEPKPDFVQHLQAAKNDDVGFLVDRESLPEDAE